MREVLLPLPGRDQSYRIVIEPGLRSRLGTLLNSLHLSRRLFLISDQRVARLHAAPVVAALAAAGLEPVLLTTPPGERAKSWPVVQRLARELLERGAHGARLSWPWGAGWWGTSPAFWPPSSCGACLSSKCPPPCWPWWTPPSAARPPSISPKAKTSWAPFTNPGWWPSIRNFCRPAPG